MHGARAQPSRSKSSRAPRTPRGGCTGASHDWLAWSNGTPINGLPGKRRLGSLGWHAGPRRRRSAGCWRLSLLQSGQHSRIRRHDWTDGRLACQSWPHLRAQRHIGTGGAGTAGTGGDGMSWGRRPGNGSCRRTRHGRRGPGSSRGNHTAGWSCHRGGAGAYRRRASRTRLQGSRRSGRTGRTGRAAGTDCAAGAARCWCRHHTGLRRDTRAGQRLPRPGENLSWPASGRFGSGGNRSIAQRGRVGLARHRGEGRPRPGGLPGQWRPYGRRLGTHWLLRLNVRYFHGLLCGCSNGWNGRFF